MKRKQRKTIDVRQILAIGLIALFSVVTVEHVAQYIGSFEPPGEQWVGYVYAVGGDFAIAACALFTRWKTTKRLAWVSYGLLVAVECVFNVCYLTPWKAANLGAWTYSLYPTAIVAVLSLLQRQVDALTGASAGASSVLGALFARIGVEAAEDGAQEAQEQPQPAPQVTATIGHWREIVRGMDGARATCAQADVDAAVIAAGFALPSPRARQEWAKRTREGRL